MGAVLTPNNLGNFSHKDNYISVDKTTAPHHAAHPDSTLLMAGLSRFSVNDSTSINELQFIGATTSIAVMESQTVSPIKELGSSRYIFTTNNNPVTIQMNSLLINGPNMLKALYGAAVGLGITGIDVQQFSTLLEDDYGAFSNLDYPIFSVPFGLAIISRSTTGRDIIANYAECCLIQSWAWRLQSGQSAVFTDATIICDRVLPMRFGAGADFNVIDKKLNELATGNEAGITGVAEVA